MIYFYDIKKGLKMEKENNVIYRLNLEVSEFELLKEHININKLAKNKNQAAINLLKKIEKPLQIKSSENKVTAIKKARNNRMLNKKFILEKAIEDLLNSNVKINYTEITKKCGLQYLTIRRYITPENMKDENFFKKNIWKNNFK